MKTVFLLAFGLGMCEGVDEDLRHEIGHVNIQVGSCIYLSVIVAMTCALRWGVTHVGNYLYWALLMSHPYPSLAAGVPATPQKSLVVISND